MTDSSEIGRYGTLRLLKRHEPETTVAFFPIDDETVTFGRSKECSVRLYYDCVSELHCTLHFSEEHKAFLRIQGTNGLLVDGCQVNPSGPSAGPTTVPLSNGSEIEIYKKRFKFEYPPKEIRAALLATPRNVKSRRSLRMSMIRSAQVFTPRASGQNLPRTPRRGSIRDNVEWEALRSPVKVSCQDTGIDEEMLLLEGQGDDAVVVEEEKDIIILQQVGNDTMENSLAPSPSKPQTRPARSVAFSIPSSTPPRHVPIPQSVQAAQQAQPLPSNRRRSAPSLHRAVVLRSAQRALEREREKFEEELEEDEVEAEVSPERELGPLEANSDGEEADNGLNDEDQDQEGGPMPQRVVPSNAPTPPPRRRMSVFQASLDAMRKVIPVSPFIWKAPEEVPLPDDEGDEDEDVAELEQDEADGDFDTHAELRTPIRRNLGPFMTPQVQVNRPAQRVPVDARTRASIGGEGTTQRTFGGAQRVRVVPAWKVKDIVLPEPEKQSQLEQQQQQEVKKERISEEERRAIMERRKSAVHVPSLLPMPGPRSSTFPLPQPGDAYTPGESDEDAETMLEKMRQKMAHVKRKSEARRVRMSVGSHQQGEEFSLLAPGVERSDRILFGTGSTEEIQSQMKRAEPIDSRLGGHSLEDTGPRPSPHDQDELNILDVSSDDDESPLHGAERVAQGPNSNSSSLTPRFDGVREMFRRPPVEPKTPSFAGFRKMFHERSQAPPKTPSFRGVREMFNRAYTANVPATPHLDLGDMFDDEEYDDREETTGDSANTRQSTDMDSPEDDHESPAPAHANKMQAVKSEDEAVIPTPAPKKTTRTRKTIASATKKSSRKRDIPVVEIPTAVMEEPASEEEEDEETEPTPPPTRRPTKRTAKATVTPDTDEPSGRGGSRSTKKVATATTQSTSKGIVVHKSTRTRRIVEIESESEEPTKSTRKGRGRAKPSPNNQEISENDAEEQAAKAPVKPRAGSRKAKAALTSDSEEVEPPKSRRGRPVRTPQALDDINEDTSALTTTKAARTKVEDVIDVEGVAQAAKVPKSRRGAKIKAVEVVDDEVTISPGVDGHQSEVEDITPASRKGRVAKAGAQKKTPGLKDGTSDDKENSADQHPKSTGKTPAVRTRKTPATTPLEADVPAKRTRSRK